MTELDKTIEELEADVLAELEEASEKPLGKGHDLGLGSNNADEDVANAKDPAPNVAGADKKETVAGERKDLGGLDGQDEKTDKTDASDQSEHEIGKKATAASKEVSGDAQQKSAAKADAPKKLAAGDEIDHDGEELEENKKMTKAQALEQIGKMKKSDIEEKIKSISVKEDVEALVEGEEFSEEFKQKAAHIFEAAVKSKIRSEVERIVDETKSEKDQEIETFVEEMTEKVDNYLNYVVDEWTKENELAIERGLKGEIAEDFISGLKQLFEDHYIDVPDEKYDVLEAQSEKISELEEKLNEAIQKNVEFKTSNNELVREQVILEVADDLADTESEKFKSLTQDVEFVDEDSFREKLDTLKENYFPRVNKSSDVTVDYEDGGTAQDIDTTDAMKSYMSAISRNKARAE